MPTAAVIIPILDERDNIERLVAALDPVLVGIDAEIIFVDDWSRDGSADVVTRIARDRRDIRLIRRFGRRGLASAVIEGMLATTADIVAVMDGDLQHDEAVLPDMIAAIARGESDIAIASRYRPGGSCGDWAQDRAALSRVATWLARTVVGCTVSDPLSGFFAVRRDLAVSLVPRLSGGGFKILLDMLAAAPAPLAIREFPYRFRCRTAGESKLGSGVAFDFLRLLARRGARRLIGAPLDLLAVAGAFGLLLAGVLLATSGGTAPLIHGRHWSVAAILAVAAASGSTMLASLMRSLRRDRAGLA